MGQQNMRLLVIGDTDLPAEHRWAILRPQGDAPVLAVKKRWCYDIRTLTEAMAALPTISTGEDVTDVQRLSIDARHPERRHLTYRQRA